MLRHLLALRSLMVLLATLLLAAAEPTQAQQDTVRARIRRLLVQALPPWDTTVLQVPVRGLWAKDLSFTQLLAAMRDSAALPKDLPRDADQVQFGETTVRVQPARGRIRYISGERAWKPDSANRARLPDSAQALAVVRAALQELPLPKDELGTPVLLRQMAASGPLTSRVATDTVEMYWIVTLPRRINSLPVEESRVLASVSDRAAIQRLLVVWPPFRVKGEVQLRSRNEVIEEALGQIMQQSPAGRLTISARLVYAPHGDDEDVWYLPAVSIAVASPPTPYVVVVAVAR